MSSSSRDPSDDVPVVHVAPIVPWQEPAAESPPVPLAYRAVELPAEPGSAAEPGPSSYPLAVAPAEDPAEARRRRREILDLRAERPHRRPRRWPLERHWSECLRYPLLAWKPLCGFALALAFATAWLVLLVPAAQNVNMLLLVLPVPIVLPLLAGIYGCAFLQGVLSTGVAGEPPSVPWLSLWHFLAALRCVEQWLMCFLAGPALLVLAAVVYWIQRGDLDRLDQLILAEIGIVAAGYWLFAILAATRSSRAFEANPLRILELMRRLGYRALVAILVAALLAYPNTHFLLAGIAEVHRNPVFGWLCLFFGWLSALACAAFVLRLLGVWSYRRLGVGVTWQADVSE